MKAQVSVEYFIIISVAFVILLPLIVYVNEMLNNYKEGMKVSLAKNAVKKLGESADWVYSQGEPAKLTVEVYIPDGITEISLENKTILFKVRTSAGVSDIFYNTISSLNGSIPRNSGYYYIQLTAYKNYVNISLVG